jgi:hypothetical protein
MREVAAALAYLREQKRLYDEAIAALEALPARLRGEEKEDDVDDESLARDGLEGTVRGDGSGRDRPRLP